MGQRQSTQSPQATPEPTTSDSSPPDSSPEPVFTGDSSAVLGNHEPQDTGNQQPELEVTNEDTREDDQPTAQSSSPVEPRESGRLPGPGWGSQFKVPLIAYGPPLDVQLHRHLQEVKQALGYTPPKGRHANAQKRSTPEPSPIKSDNELQRPREENKGEVFPLATPAVSQDTEGDSEDTPQLTITKKVNLLEIVQNGEGETKVGTSVVVVETIETIDEETNNVEEKESHEGGGETETALQPDEETESQSKEKLTKKRKKRKPENVIPSRHSKRLSVRSSSRS